MTGVMLLHADYSKNGEVVTDDQSGLMWQDNSDTASKKMNWSSAIGYCEDLELGGHTDWRLPNLRELKSVVDRSRYMPAINPVFMYKVSDWYWSSTTYANGTNGAWLVHFGSGDDSYNGNKDDSYYVRCVRGGQ